MSWGEEDKSLEWIVYDTLEKENKKLKAKNEKLREVAGDAYDWAILHRIEMRSGVWHRLKRELERA